MSDVSQLDPQLLIGSQIIWNNLTTEQPAHTTIADYDDDLKQFRLEYKRGGDNVVTQALIQEALIARMSNNAEGQDGYSHWIPKKILNHKATKHGTEVLVQWDTGAETWELVTAICKEGPMLLAQYAYNNNLTDQHGFKWTCSLTKNPKHYLCLAQLFKAT
jgi:hypothetical protein